MNRRAALFLVAFRSLRHHLLSAVVTAGSIALAGGLVMAVFTISTQAEEAFTGGPIGYDAILGAKGSGLQQVLNSVYHLETSPGNIPWSAYEEIREDPRVRYAIPYAVGDNYRGHRIVGTTGEIFSRFRFEGDRGLRILDGGRPFDPERAEAVIGSSVARRTGLRVGDHFQPYHGLVFNEHEQHGTSYLVVGITEPSNTPMDGVLWIPIEGLFRMEDHELHGAGEAFVAKPGEAIPDEHKEVSAVMLRLVDPAHGRVLQQRYLEAGGDRSFVWPLGAELAKFFRKLGWMTTILEVVAWLVVVVAVASVLAALHNTMNERRREFAILRSLGAGRREVFLVIVLEAGTIAAVGALGSFLVFGSIVFGASRIIRDQTGVVIDVFAPSAVLFLTPVLLVILGALAGVLPALRAYRGSVVRNLGPSS